MISFSLIIPVYNEEENVVNLCDEILKEINFTENFEIIIVDDCSTDKSYELLNEFKDNKKFKILKNYKNEGQSFSIFNGIKNSKYDCNVTIDADGQNDPRDLKKLVQKYFEFEDVKLVAGIRVKRKDNIVKILSSKIANNIRSYILKDKCVDTGCSLKVFDKSIIKNFPYFNGIHRFLPALFNGFGHKVIFVNVNHRKRLYGKSKYGTFQRLFQGFSDLLYVKKIISKKND